MKSLLSLVSSVLLGLWLAAGGGGPILQLQRLLGHKRRILCGLILGAAAFVFVMAAILLAMIDLASQYEEHGFVLWNAILALAAGFLVTGVILAVGARISLPRREPIL